MSLLSITELKRTLQPDEVFTVRGHIDFIYVRAATSSFKIKSDDSNTTTLRETSYIKLVDTVETLYITNTAQVSNEIDIVYGLGDYKEASSLQNVNIVNEPTVHVGSPVDIQTNAPLDVQFPSPPTVIVQDLAAETGDKLSNVYAVIDQARNENNNKADINRVENSTRILDLRDQILSSLGTINNNQNPDQSTRLDTVISNLQSIGTSTADISNQATAAQISNLYAMLESEHGQTQTLLQTEFDASQSQISNLYSLVQDFKNDLRSYKLNSGRLMFTVQYGTETDNLNVFFGLRSMGTYYIAVHDACVWVDPAIFPQVRVHHSQGSGLPFQNASTVGFCSQSNLINNLGADGLIHQYENRNLIPSNSFICQYGNTGTNGMTVINNLTAESYAVGGQLYTDGDGKCENLIPQGSPIIIPPSTDAVDGSAECHAYVIGTFYDQNTVHARSIRATFEVLL